MDHPKRLSPLTLAFLGDAVYELEVRRKLVEEHGSMPPKKLHEMCVAKVRASAQHQSLVSVWDILTQEEQQMVKRGRNSSGVTVPKSASPAEYRYATGLETLLGYLYLNGDAQRLQAVLDALDAASPESAQPSKEIPQTESAESIAAEHQKKAAL